MSYDEIKLNLTKLKELRDGLKEKDNYKCIDCYIRRINELVSSLNFEDVSESNAKKQVKKSIVDYYLNHFETNVIVDSLSTLIDVMEKKIH